MTKSMNIIRLNKLERSRKKNTTTKSMNNVKLNKLERRIQ